MIEMINFILITAETKLNYLFNTDQLDSKSDYFKQVYKK